MENLSNEIEHVTSLFPRNCPFALRSNNVVKFLIAFSSISTYQVVKTLKTIESRKDESCWLLAINVLFFLLYKSNGLYTFENK